MAVISPREPIYGLPGRRQNRFAGPIYPFQRWQARHDASDRTVRRIIRRLTGTAEAQA